MSNFAAATSYRPTPELMHQLFIKYEVTTARWRCGNNSTKCRCRKASNSAV